MSRDNLFYRQRVFLEANLKRKLTDYEFHKVFIVLENLPCEVCIYQKALDVFYELLDEAKITKTELMEVGKDGAGGGRKPEGRQGLTKARGDQPR